MKDRRHSGFTMIELLVIMAIIGVLFSMLMPAIRQARNKAVAVECIGKLKQIGIELAMDSDDAKGKMYLYTESTDTDVNESWAGRMRIAKDRGRDLFVCPAHAPRHFDSTNRWLSTYGLYRPQNPSHLPYCVLREGDTYYLNVNRVEDTSDFALAADSTANGWDGRFGVQWKFFWPNGTPSVHARHNDRANVLFVDGHVDGCDRTRLEGLGITAVYGPVDSWGYTP